MQSPQCLCKNQIALYRQEILQTQVLSEYFEKDRLLREVLVILIFVAPAFTSCLRPYNFFHSIFRLYPWATAFTPAWRARNRHF